jgi:hypothetical protein
MGTSEHDDVKEDLLIEGLRDWIRLGEPHATFLFDNHTPKRRAAEAQQLTLSMIRELVSEGLFVLGVPDKKAPDSSLGACRSMRQWPKSRRDTWPTSMTAGAGPPARGYTSPKRGGLWRCSCITPRTVS